MFAESINDHFHNENSVFLILPVKKLQSYAIHLPESHCFPSKMKYITEITSISKTYRDGQLTSGMLKGGGQLHLYILLKKAASNFQKAGFQKM